MKPQSEHPQPGIKKPSHPAPAISKWLCLLILLLTLSACRDNKPVNEKQAEECALNFAQSFFNFKYREALGYCSDQSQQWMKFYVSNITHADIDSIRKLPQTPKIKLQRVEKSGSDSTAEAFCKIENGYFLDSLGRSGTLVPEAVVKIKMVLENDSWKVKLNELRRVPE